ncbi:hypothetical protein [Mucilaginibacter lappiensis]|uniref:Uncharacterized protein n=1 Tax=Mucilaginibacter lappiensis TaxID=354630 RepID=A0A841JGI9_9SPHI|nr:hypothetical protein [Mucilaginibacter lappiensis]MBB6130279.1 hypothetical protein [Mucilaginibacter lappiensis]
MEKPRQEEIPRSIIKGSSGRISGLNGKGEMLFADPKCFVVGLEKLPYILFTTPEFNEEELPLNIGKQIYEIKKLALQSTFSADISKEVKYCAIPRWLSDFKMVEELRFGYVEIDDLHSLKDLPIQNLILKNIRYNDSQRVVSAIKQFKHLKEVSYDQSLDADLKQAIEELNLKLTLLADSD